MAPQIGRLLRDLVAEGAAAGELRGDVPPDELAGYCLHALSAIGVGPAASGAVGRLVDVILTGLRPPSDGSRDPRAARP